MTSLADALELSTRETLETMCFAEALGGDESVPADRLPIGVRVPVLGDFRGEFRLGAEAGVARELASEFLACEDEELLDDTLLTRVMGELANIVCGSTMARSNPASRFTLGAPEGVAWMPEPPGTVRRTFDVSGKALRCLLRLDVSETPDCAHPGRMRE